MQGSANESVVLGHIDFIAANLASFGYRVVCMDAGWFISSSSSLTYLDQVGRPQVDPVRYPSAVGQQGFRRLAAYAHSKGLLLGIHTMRGAHVQAVQLKLPVLGTEYTIDQVVDPEGACPWWPDFLSLNMSHPAAQPFYDSLYSQASTAAAPRTTTAPHAAAAAAHSPALLCSALPASSLPQYAEWGIDFIKMDWSARLSAAPAAAWVASARLLTAALLSAVSAFAVNAVLDDVRGVSEAIFSSGREMLLSLSPGKSASPEQVEAVRGLANMYRITDDAWDDWSHLQDHLVPSVVLLHRYIGAPNARYGLPSFPVAETAAPQRALAASGLALTPPLPPSVPLPCRTWTCCRWVSDRSCALHRPLLSPPAELLLLPPVRESGWIAEPGISSQPYHLSSLSLDEQRTLMSYWTMWRAPLIMGGDLLKPDPFSLQLITHAPALQITDHSVNNAPLSSDDPRLAVWRADSDDWQRDGVSYVSVHNLQNESAVLGITVASSRRPTQTGDVCLVQDVWTGEMLGSRGQISVNLRRHASAIFKLSECTEGAGSAEE